MVHWRLALLKFGLPNRPSDCDHIKLARTCTMNEKKLWRKPLHICQQPALLHGASNKFWPFPTLHPGDLASMNPHRPCLPPLNPLWLSEKKSVMVSLRYGLQVCAHCGGMTPARSVDGNQQGLLIKRIKCVLLAEVCSKRGSRGKSNILNCWSSYNNGVSYHTILAKFIRVPGRPELITKPRHLAVIRNRRLNSVALLAPLRSVQFSSVQFSDQGGESACLTIPYHAFHYLQNKHPAGLM